MPIDRSAAQLPLSLGARDAKVGKSRILRWPSAMGDAAAREYLISAPSETVPKPGRQNDARMPLDRIVCLTRRGRVAKVSP
jgi:hypothetical protein